MMWQIISGEEKMVGSCKIDEQSFTIYHIRAFASINVKWYKCKILANQLKKITYINFSKIMHILSTTILPV